MIDLVDLIDLIDLAGVREKAVLIDLIDFTDLNDLVDLAAAISIAPIWLLGVGLVDCIDSACPARFDRLSARDYLIQRPYILDFFTSIFNFWSSAE